LGENSIFEEEIEREFRTSINMMINNNFTSSGSTHLEEDVEREIRLAREIANNSRRVRQVLRTNSPGTSEGNRTLDIQNRTTTRRREQQRIHQIFDEERALVDEEIDRRFESGQFTHTLYSNMFLDIINDKPKINTSNVNFFTLINVLNIPRDCSICLTEIDENVLKTSCKHYFCKGCLDEWINVKQHTNCPNCRHEFHV
jgi:hypothetical protein